MTGRKQHEDDAWEPLEKGHQPIREPDEDGASAGYQPETSQGDDGPPGGEGSGKK